MYYRIEEMSGLDRSDADRLARAGVATTEDLLDLCAEPKGCDDVAEASGLRREAVLAWARQADLMRIDGVGPLYSGLLAAAGVDSLTELGRRDAEALTETLDEINGRRRLTRISPPPAMVGKWIAQAGTTRPRIVC